VEGDSTTAEKLFGVKFVEEIVDPPTNKVFMA
jgi:hypothetical protein